MAQGGTSPLRRDEINRVRDFSRLQNLERRQQAQETNTSSGGYESSLGEDNSHMRDALGASVLDLPDEDLDDENEEEGEEINELPSAQADSADQAAKQRQMTKTRQQFIPTAEDAFSGQQTSSSSQTGLAAQRTSRPANAPVSAQEFEAERNRDIAQAAAAEALQSEANDLERLQGATVEQKSGTQTDGGEEPQNVFDVIIRVVRHKEFGLLKTYMNLFESPNKLISFELYFLALCNALLQLLAPIIIIVIIVAGVIMMAQGLLK